MATHLAFTKLSGGWVISLSEFFDIIKKHSLDRFFSPHNFDLQMAVDICNYTGEDLYAVLVEGDRILGYGMLRGWDEGYAIPSIGIAIRPDEHGKGFGRLVMSHLHEIAISRGSTRIRLRVHKENTTAIALYQSLGYALSVEADGPFFLGIKKLSARVQ